MTKKFKDIKCGEFFFMEGTNMGVKVKNVIPEKELYWSCEDFNTVVMGLNGRFYRTWVEDNEEFSIPTEEEIVDFMGQNPRPPGRKFYTYEAKKSSTKHLADCTKIILKSCAVCQWFCVPLGVILKTRKEKERTRK